MEASKESPLKIETPVVVLNTHHTGLGIARSLGPLGVRVIGVTHFPGFPGNYSRWVDYRPSADSATEPERLVEQLITIADELGVRAVLFPTRDHDIHFIGRFHEPLRRHFILPPADSQSLAKILDKSLLLEAAQAANVAVPANVTVRSAAERGLARGLRYPCICKPVFGSQWRKQGIWDAVGRRKAVKVDSYAEFSALHERLAALDPLVIVQQWIEGDDTDLLIVGAFCNANFEVSALFTARKLLQEPPLIGTGVVVEARPIPDIDGPARALLRALRFHGVAEIEFKRDRGDGRVYLIEVNPRHWDQHRVGALAGVDVTEVAYRDATQQPPRPMRQRPEPVRWIAEREFAGHMVRAVLGRAPLSDLASAFGAERTWSVYDARDRAPFLALIGFRQPFKPG
jgi:predicted ATP-grasp superfamily ATP-dependent carboligase